MQVIEFQEEQDCTLPKNALDEETALELYNHKHFSLEYPNPGNNFTFRLRSNGWVGHIPVGNCLFVVKPKVPVSNVFRMLEVAYGLKSFQFFEGETEIETLQDLFERIVSLLAVRVLNRARKGLYRAYVEEMDNLGVVRGRIDLRRNLENHLRARPRVHCRYEELTADLRVNQILLWTLFVASRMNLSRESVRAQVRNAYRALSGTVELSDVSPSECLKQRYNRLNEDYRAMHALCYLILTNAGPTISRGTEQFLPFELNMPQLFEDFLRALLEDAIALPNFVKSQVPRTLHGKPTVIFRPDFLIQDCATGQISLILDAKYKAYARPLEADLQQITAYATAFDASAAGIVYPTDSAPNFNLKIGDIYLQSFKCNISGELDTSINNLLQNIMTLVSASNISANCALTSETESAPVA